jgi:hypothetical protein
MEAVWVPILVALIGGPVMWFLTRFDRRNTEQHGENQKVLTRIEKKIEHLDGRIDDHITWHAHDKQNP